MRLIISLFFSLFLTLSLSTSAISADVEKLRQDIKQLEGSTNPQDIEAVQALQGTINWINDGEKAQVNADNYQKTIDDYPQITQELRTKLLAESHAVPTIPEKISIPDLEQKIIQVSSQLMEQARLQQQEQDKSREISESLNLLPQQLSEARRLLSDATARLASASASTTPLTEAQNKLTQAEVTARKAMVNELEMAQLSANNRQESARLRLELFKKRYQRLDVQLQQLRSLLNIKRQEVADLALEKTEMLAEQGGELPEFLTKQIQTNRELSQILNKQTQEMSELSEKLGMDEEAISVKINKGLAKITELALELSNSSIGALYTSGGDVTMEVMKRLGVEGIDIKDEIIPLAVYGRFIGGKYPNMPAITKGGLIGDKKTLSLCIDYLATKVSTQYYVK